MASSTSLNSTTSPSIHFSVGASFPILHRRPWPMVGWLGESKDDLLLVREKRIRLARAPSGKLKKRIKKIDPLNKDVVLVGLSADGRHLGILTTSGDVVIWTKDSDQVRFVAGFSELVVMLQQQQQQQQQHCNLRIADDGSRLVLVLDGNQIFVWDEKEEDAKKENKSPNGQGGLDSDNGRTNGWTEIRTPFRSADLTKTFPPSPVDHPELTIDCRFTNLDSRDDEVVRRFQAAWCYSEPDHLRFIYLTIVWENGGGTGGLNRDVRWEWNHIAWSLFLAPDSPPSATQTNSLSEPRLDPPIERESLLSALSPSSSVLALALNRSQSHNNRVVFLSFPWYNGRRGAGGGGFLQSYLFGSGAPEPLRWKHRWFWTKSMTWSADGIFVYVLTRQGALFVLTALGEPHFISARGCGVDLGLTKFLTIHPLVDVDDSRKLKKSNQNHEVRPQFHVVTAHPRDPTLLLVSDGYMVTILRQRSDALGEPGVNRLGTSHFDVGVTWALLVAAKLDAAEEGLRTARVCLGRWRMTTHDKYSRHDTSENTQELTNKSGTIAKSQTTFFGKDFILADDAALLHLVSGLSLLAAFPPHLDWPEKLDKFSAKMAAAAFSVCKLRLRYARCASSSLIDSRLTDHDSLTDYIAADILTNCVVILRLSRFDFQRRLTPHLLKFARDVAERIFLPARLLTHAAILWKFIESVSFDGRRVELSLRSKKVIEGFVVGKKRKSNARYATVESTKCIPNADRALYLLQWRLSNHRMGLNFVAPQGHRKFVTSLSRSVYIEQNIDSCKFLSRALSVVARKNPLTTTDYLFLVQRLAILFVACLKSAVAAELSTMRFFDNLLLTLSDAALSHDLFDVISSLLVSQLVTMIGCFRRFDYNLVNDDVALALFIACGNLKDAISLARERGAMKAGLAIAISDDLLAERRSNALVIGFLRSMTLRLVQRMIDPDEDDVKMESTEPFLHLLHAISVSFHVGAERRFLTWLLKSLLTKLKTVVHGGTPPFVHPDFPLPTPPVFMPQIGYDRDVSEDYDKLAVEAESHLRHRVSKLIRLTLAILRYFVEVKMIRRKMVEDCRRLFKKLNCGSRRVDKSTRAFLRMLKSESFYSGPRWKSENAATEAQEVTYRVVRQLFSLIWMFHVRDQTSLSFRLLDQTHGFAINHSYTATIMKTPSLHRSWRAVLKRSSLVGATSPIPTNRLLRACCLWSQQLLPFSIFLHCRPAVEDAILSTVEMMTTDTWYDDDDADNNVDDAAILLATAFHDADDVESAVYERLAELLKRWRSVRADCSSAKTLSMVFTNHSVKCASMNETLRAEIRGFRHFVFDPRVTAPDEDDLSTTDDFAHKSSAEFGCYPHERHPGFVEQVLSWWDLLFPPLSSDALFGGSSMLNGNDAKNISVISGLRRDMDVPPTDDVNKSVVVEHRIERIDKSRMGSSKVKRYFSTFTALRPCRMRLLIDEVLDDSKVKREKKKEARMSAVCGEMDEFPNLNRWLSDFIHCGEAHISAFFRGGQRSSAISRLIELLWWVDEWISDDVEIDRDGHPKKLRLDARLLLGALVPSSGQTHRDESYQDIDSSRDIFQDVIGSVERLWVVDVVEPFCSDSCYSENRTGDLVTNESGEILS